MDIAARIASRLVGHCLLEVERSDYDWLFRFENSIGLRATCPWRIIAEGRIAHGDSDHAQQFGLPKPIDGAARSGGLLINKPIENIAIREDTGDLTISFEGKIVLEILNTSSGYEGWQLNDGASLNVIAMGGGELALWNSPS